VLAAPQLPATPSHRPGEGYQGRQNTLPSQHCISASTTQLCIIYQEHHGSSTAIATHQKSHPAKHLGGQVKHKTKSGASSGGEGQAAAKPGVVDQQEASQHQQQLHTATLLHNYRLR
jgi:hypothetical protein